MILSISSMTLSVSSASRSVGIFSTLWDFVFGIVLNISGKSQIWQCALNNLGVLADSGLNLTNSRNKWSYVIVYILRNVEDANTSNTWTLAHILTSHSNDTAADSDRLSGSCFPQELAVQDAKEPRSAKAEVHSLQKRLAALEKV